MKLLVSLAIIAAPILIYWFVIRPRLEVKFSETYAYLGGFWERQWARVVAFRTWIIGFVGILASELPGILSQLSLMDFSDLPTAWQTTIRVATIIGMMWSRAVATTPGSEPEKP